MTSNPVTHDRKVIHFPKDLSARVSRYRFGNEIGSEAEAIRRLIELGLAASAAGQGGGGESLEA